MKTIYKYHKQIGIVIMIPVFLWVFSGFMHPFAANWFRPSIAKTFLFPSVIKQTEDLKSFKSVVEEIQIEGVQDVRIINFEEQNYYQIHLGNDSLVYANGNDGSISKNIDDSYATGLARQFLADDSSNVLSVEKVTSFNTEYREINRLLPVWKVAFDRADGMELYIHTASSRLGTFNNNARKIHIRIFNWFHNWGFLPFSENVRIVWVGVISGLIMLCAFLGLSIYVVNWKRFGKISADNQAVKKRKSHRRYGIIFSVFMLLFSFSGSYHVWNKLGGDHRREFFDASTIAVEKLDASIEKEVLAKSERLVGFGIKNLNGAPYYRISTLQNKQKLVKYYDCSSGKILKKGDQIYAVELAKRFTQEIDEDTPQLVTSFGGEYGFVNKRLPVWKVPFKTTDNLTAYIETKTGKLASMVNDSDRKEGWSFAVLHKFHFLDGFGRNFRDIFTMLSAITLLVITWKGFRIYKRKKS